MTLLVASTNPGKLREIRQVLEHVPLELRSLADLSPISEPVERGRTFAENALVKARYYAVASGLPTVAEDSGLTIAALGGRPGVESARYPGATYPDKFFNLYRELQTHPRPWRAGYVCSVAFVSSQAPDQALGTRPWALGSPASAECRVPSASEAAFVRFTGEASVDGEISPEPRGTSGFGYDPIFYYPPYGATFGEVSDERKLAVAHRGRAFREFAAYLLSFHHQCKQ